MSENKSLTPPKNVKTCKKGGEDYLEKGKTIYLAEGFIFTKFRGTFFRAFLAWGFVVRNNYWQNHVTSQTAVLWLYNHPKASG